MPFKVSAFRRMGKRRFFKRVGKKSYRPKTISRPLRRKLGLNVHHFKYCTLVKNYLQVEMNGVDVPFSRSFIFSDITNYGELAALFDMYRINGVSYKLIPRQNTLAYQTAPGAGSPPAPNTDFGGTNLFGSSNYGWPETCTVLDYDDDSTPTNLTDIMQYSSFKLTRGNKIHTRYLKPRLLVDPSNTGLSLRHKWVDCEKTTLKHYGIKGFITNVPNITPSGTSDHPVMFYDLLLTYYISLKDTK